MPSINDGPNLSDNEQGRNRTPPPSPMTMTLRAIQAQIQRQPGIEDEGPIRFPSEQPEAAPSPPESTGNELAPRKRPLPRSPTMRHLSAQAQEMGKSKRLRPESVADIVRFTQMPGLERELFMACVALQCRDKLNDAADSADWHLPAQLKTNCVRYTSACVLSPTIPSYKLAFSTLVMNMLRALEAEHPGSSQLPSGLHASQTELVISEINTIAIKKRSELKIKIEKSLETKDCIELLCESIASPLNITVTTLLYARIAFLRQQCVAYPEMRDPKKFWGHVDKKLKTMREQFPLKETMTIAMEHFLAEDRKMFTNGKDAKQYSFTDPLSTPAWQQAAEKELETIVPTQASQRAQPVGGGVQQGGAAHGRQTRSSTPQPSPPTAPGGGAA